MLEPYLADHSFSTAEELPIEFHSLKATYLSTLIEAGQDQAAADRFAGKLAEKRLRGETLSGQDEDALMGLIDINDID